MPRIRSIPEKVLKKFIDDLARDAETIERRHSPEDARFVRSIIEDLTKLVSDRRNCWIDTAKAEEILKVDAETVRRWCRTSEDGDAILVRGVEIEIQDDGGRYYLWAPDVDTLAAKLAEARAAKRAKARRTVPVKARVAAEVRHAA